MVAFEQIVKAIMVLVVVGVAIAIPLNILMGKETNLVRVMLGLGGNISELDKELMDEFKYTAELHKTASDSMLGLTYSINALAVTDYHDNLDEAQLSRLTGYATKRNEGYGFKGENTQVNVKTLPLGLKRLDLGAEDNADKAKLKLTMAIVDCWRRYKDVEFENKNCNQVYVDDGFNWGIGEGDIQGWFKGGNIKKLEAEYNRIYPEAKDVKGYVELAEDLLGNGWINGKEVHWINNVVINKNTKNIVICGNDRGVLGFRGVLITDDWTNCETKVDGTKYQYLVENFELPQELRKSGGFYDSVTWLETHGDPKYLVYYEVFPKGEDKQWEHFSWETFAVGVGIAVVAEGLGYGVIRLASPVWGVVKGTGKLFLKIPGVKALKELTERGMKELLETIGIKIAKEAAEKSTKEFTEEGVEKVLNVALRKGKLLSKSVTDKLGKETSEKMVTRARKAIIGWQKTPGWSSKYLKNGIITKEGTKKLNEKLTSEFGEELAERLGKKTSEEIIGEITEIAAKASKEAFDPKFLGKIYSARNGRKLLKDTFKTAQEAYEEGGEAAARKVLKESLDPTYKILEKLEPNDLVKIVRKNKDAARLVWEDGVGIDWTIFGGKPLSAMDDWSKVIGTTLEESKFSSRILGGTSSFVKGHTKDWAILVGSMMLADYIMSKQAKYINVGENAIGLKVPNEDVVIYGQKRGIWKQGLMTIDWNDDKGEFLKNYGEGGNVGLLPEAGAYYLQLERDKLDWWPDQDPTRFFLVSPCKADVYLTVDRCECFGNEEDDLEHPEYVKDFSDGKFENNKMMYKKIGEYDNPTKICNPNSWFDDDIFAPQYSPMCIKINPLIDETYPNNFCYSGSHRWQEGTQVFLRGVQVVDLVMIGVSTVVGPTCTAATAGLCALVWVPSIGVMMAIAGGAEASIRLIETTKAWPDHGSGT